MAIRRLKLFSEQKEIEEEKKQRRLLDKRLSLKKSIQSGEKNMSAWQEIGHPWVSGIMSQNTHTVIIDGEHGDLDDKDFILMQDAMKQHSALPIIRVKGHDPDTIKRVLDKNVFGIMVPQVDNATQCRNIVNACKYRSQEFPEGKRGTGPVYPLFVVGDKNYLDVANEATLVMVQIESITAVNNIDAIMQVPGVDIFFVGPSDLATSMRLKGQQPDHPEIKAAMNRVEEAARRHGKALGTVNDSGDEALLEDLFQRGYSMVTMGLDARILQEMMATRAKAFERVVNKTSLEAKESKSEEKTDSATLTRLSPRRTTY